MTATWYSRAATASGAICATSFVAILAPSDKGPLTQCQLLIVLIVSGFAAFVFWVLGDREKKREKQSASLDAFRDPVSGLMHAVRTRIAVVVDSVLARETPFSDWQALFDASVWPSRLEETAELGKWEPQTEVEKRALWCAGVLRRNLDYDASTYRLAINRVVTRWISWFGDAEFCATLKQLVTRSSYRTPLLFYAYMEIENARFMHGTEPAGEWRRLPEKLPLLKEPNLAP